MKAIFAWVKNLLNILVTVIFPIFTVKRKYNVIFIIDWFLNLWLVNKGSAPIIVMIKTVLLL